MQLDIMLFFQSIQNGFLSFLANFFSFFGEETAMLVILLPIYWAWNKKNGFIIFSNLMSSMGVMQVTKGICRVDRPFVQHPELINADRVETATGYSFPSGHSTGSSSFYSGLFRLYDRTWLRVLTAVIIIGVPLSRLYLGVHWPADVLVGTALGLCGTIFLTPVFSKLWDDKEKLSKVYKTGGIIISAVSLILALVLTFTDADKTAWSDTQKLCAVMGAGMIGVALETKYLKFKTEGTAAHKAERIAIGIVGMVLLQLLKLIFPSSVYSIGCFFRYSLIGLWATWLFPMLAVKIGIMEKE